MAAKKHKSITELRSSLFETFDEVCNGTTQFITHKNGNVVAMLSSEELERLKSEIELHKNLAIGYAQALREEGISSNELKKKFEKK
ncbi:MAG: type II toxin-antitoxin system Phd/YefM family antitoxin [Oligoflexia bacterium]|nr:type II toxin-antitoxin system Phd/YefM family antitoxin [Oligoflexia bacterium]